MTHPDLPLRHLSLSYSLGERDEMFRVGTANIYLKVLLNTQSFVLDIHKFCGRPNIWPFLFCIRIENFEGAHTGQTFLEISNDRKTVRMAPIVTIFGPNESQRCQLNFAKILRCRKSFREDENFKKLSRKVRTSLSRVRFLTKSKMEMAT